MKPKIKITKEFSNPYKGAIVGEIYRAKNNKNLHGISDHYMVITSLEDPERITFEGVMLTSSTRYGNIPIPTKYFLGADSPGTSYDFPVKTTFMTKHKRVKFVDWAPFYLVGKLTDEGLAYVNSKIEGLEPTKFSKNFKESQR